MGNVQTDSVSFRLESQFRVLLDGQTEAGTFTKAGPLMKGKAEKATIDSGTSLTEEAMEPGKIRYEPVTLEQGASENSVLRDWWLQINNQGGVTGTKGPTFKRIVRIEQLDRDMTTVLESYTYKNAWLEEFDDGGFDASSSKFRTRMAKFCYLGAPTYKKGA